ncbi:hypothetical protein IAT38_003307 [Cryptococcus sp. DSM 104549]
MPRHKPPPQTLPSSPESKPQPPSSSLRTLSNSPEHQCAAVEAALSVLSHGGPEDSFRACLEKGAPYGWYDANAGPGEGVRIAVGMGPVDVEKFGPVRAERDGSEAEHGQEGGSEGRDEQDDLVEDEDDVDALFDSHDCDFIELADLSLHVTARPLPPHPARRTLFFVGTTKLLRLTPSGEPASPVWPDVQFHRAVAKNAWLLESAWCHGSTRFGVVVVGARFARMLVLSKSVVVIERVGVVHHERDSMDDIFKQGLGYPSLPHCFVRPAKPKEAPGWKVDESGVKLFYGFYEDVYSYVGNLPIDVVMGKRKPSGVHDNGDRRIGMWTIIHDEQAKEDEEARRLLLIDSKRQNGKRTRQNEAGGRGGQDSRASSKKPKTAGKRANGANGGPKPTAAVGGVDALPPTMVKLKVGSADILSGQTQEESTHSGEDDAEEEDGYSDEDDFGSIKSWQERVEAEGCEDSEYSTDGGEEAKWDGPEESCDLRDPLDVVLQWGPRIKSVSVNTFDRLVEFLLNEEPADPPPVNGARYR